VHGIYDEHVNKIYLYNIYFSMSEVVTGFFLLVLGTKNVSSSQRTVENVMFKVGFKLSRR
jgi:uncharacterized protein YybS (DUF2232 family)